MALAQRKIVGSPADFGKLGNIGALDNMSWAKIPTYYYDFRRHCLPLTTDEFNNQFGPNIPVFNLDGDPGDNRQTNAAVGSGVNEAFVALGAGVIAMGEGEAWSIHGLSITPPDAATDTPAVVLSPATCDLYCGAARINTSTGATHAALWWGGPTWKFIEKFFQSFRLQVLINHRFNIVDESLFDVGMVPVPPEFVGASDSSIPTMYGIRSVNDTMQAKGIPNLFLPPNQVIDSNASVCIPPPLAPVTYGHPRIIGLANRIYCFLHPILFLPGMRFEVFFQRVEGELCYNDMEVTSTVQTQTASALMNPEVVDPGAATDTCANHVTIPGGSVSLGVVFKGFALWPQAALDYLSRYVVDGSALMGAYSNNNHLMGWLATNKFDKYLERKDEKGNVRSGEEVRGWISGALGSATHQG